MIDEEVRGWVRISPNSYRHRCGAQVTKQGQLWVAQGVTGTTFASHASASQAMSCVEDSDSSFWSYGEVQIGFSGCGLRMTFGYLEINCQLGVFVCSSDLKDGFPSFLGPVFTKNLFGKATCAKCQSQLTELHLRALRDFEDEPDFDRNFMACDCGHPVWRLEVESFQNLMRAMSSAENAWLRKERLRTAEGFHTASQIKEILALQKNCCIYCDSEFTRELPPTKDHILALVDGGAN